MISKSDVDILMAQQLLHFFRVAWATAFLNNLAFYSEDLKLMVLAIFALKVVAS